MFVCWLSEGGKCRCVYIWNFPSLSARLPIEIRHNLAFRTAGKDWAVGRRWRCDTVFVMMGGMKRDWIKVFLNGRYDDAVKTNNKTAKCSMKIGFGSVEVGSQDTPLSPIHSSHTRPAEESTKRTTNRPMSEQKKLPTNENDIFKSLFFFSKKERKRKSKNFFLPFEKFVFLTQSGNLKNFHESSSSGGVKRQRWKILFFFISTKAKAQAPLMTKVGSPHLSQCWLSWYQSWIQSFVVSPPLLPFAFFCHAPYHPSDAMRESSEKRAKEEAKSF